MNTATRALTFVVFLLAAFPAVAELGAAYSIQSPDRLCDIQVDYLKADGPYAPSFVLRSGYSRDNDDAAQGNYETAVMDLELVGRKLPSGEVCLFIVTTATLSEEPENAQGWANQFHLRRASSFVLDPINQQWASRMPMAPSGDRFSVLQHSVPPYAQNSKYLVADGRTRQQVSIRSANYLGVFADGTYSGQSYMQTGVFSNRDASDYNVVRHIIEWKVDLKNGELSGPDQSYPTTVAGRKVLRFNNQVRMVIPPWNGTVVANSNGTSERKYHHVTLMWLDEVVKACPNGACAFQKYELVSVLKKALADDRTLTAESEIGRIRAKSVVPSNVPAIDSLAEKQQEPLTRREKRRRRS